MSAKIKILGIAPYEELNKIELFFLLKGKAEVRIDDQSYIMKRDDILVVNKHECCFIETTGNEDLLFHFSINF